MLFLSNRKLKLLIIALLLTIFAFFLGLLSPKAETISDSYGLYDIGLISSNTTYAVFNTYKSSGAIFPNKKGELLFTFYYAVDTQGGEMPYEVQVSDNSKTFICSIGTYTYWNDNSSQRATITAVCNVDFNSNGWKDITVHMNGSGNKYFRFSQIANFSNESGGNAGSIDSQLDSIYNRMDGGFSDIYNMEDAYLSTIRSKINDMYNVISSNNTTITNIQQTTTDIKNSITDSSIDSNEASSSASSWNNKNTSNGTITSLLTLPITLLQAIVNGIQTSCSTFTLGSLFNTTLTLPCINLSNFIGSELFSVIDLLISGFMILAIGKKLVKIFNDFTNLRSNQVDELYGGGQ